MPTAQPYIHQAHVSMGRDARAIAPLLAALISTDCAIGLARYLPAGAKFAPDLVSDVWPAPPEVLSRGAADCVGLVRCLGATQGDEVGCVPDPNRPGSFHVFLLQGGKVLDPSVDRGMTKPPASFYTQGLVKAKIVRPGRFPVGRLVGKETLFETFRPKGFWGMLPKASPALPQPPTPKAPPAAPEVLALLKPIVVAAKSAAPASAQPKIDALASIFTQLHARLLAVPDLAAASAQLHQAAEGLRAQLRAASLWSLNFVKRAEMARAADALDTAAGAIDAFQADPQVIARLDDSADPVNRAALLMLATVATDVDNQRATPTPEAAGGDGLIELTGGDGSTPNNAAPEIPGMLDFEGSLEAPPPPPPDVLPAEFDFEGGDVAGFAPPIEALELLELDGDMGEAPDLAPSEALDLTMDAPASDLEIEEGNGYVPMPRPPLASLMRLPPGCGGGCGAG